MVKLLTTSFGCFQGGHQHLEPPGSPNSTAFVADVCVAAVVLGHSPRILCCRSLCHGRCGSCVDSFQGRWWLEWRNETIAGTAVHAWVAEIQQLACQATASTPHRLPPTGKQMSTWASMGGSMKASEDAKSSQQPNAAMDVFTGGATWQLGNVLNPNLLAGAQDMVPKPCVLHGDPITSEQILPCVWLSVSRTIGNVVEHIVSL